MSENVITEALVNKKTGEVVEIGLQKTPTEIMIDASEAAKALEQVISSNKRKLVEFNGKRFLEFPHWQTIGRFFHSTVQTQDAEYVELPSGPKGFKAKATIIDEKTGAVTGGAEAFCMTDEPNWKFKPLFQLASMAQTRAASKALSNKYRYVAILAGYEPTPGEEVDMTTEKGLRAPKEKEKEPAAAESEIEFGDPPYREADVVSEESPPPVLREGPLITEKQRKMLFARCRAAGIDEPIVKDYLRAHFSLEHSKDLTRTQFDQMLKWIDEVKGAAA